MKKCRRVVVLVGVFLFLHIFVTGAHCWTIEKDVKGRIETAFTLRDTDGFQFGFMDEMRGWQWRNEVKFELNVNMEYETTPLVRLDNVFLVYRGAYDGIFDVRDYWDNLRDYQVDEFEFGKQDIKYENDLREAYADIVAETGKQTLQIRLGRQIIQWGEADGFNCINITNPSNHTKSLAFRTPEDVAEPLWMMRVNYGISDVGIFDSLGFEGIAIPDIRPHLIAPVYYTGQGPQTLNEFLISAATDVQTAYVVPSPYIDPLSLEVASKFPNIERIYEVVPARNADNMEFGVKLELVKGFFTGALHFFNGYQDAEAPSGNEYFQHYAPSIATAGLLSSGTITMGDVVTLMGQGFNFDPGSNFGATGLPSVGGPWVAYNHPRQRTFGFSGSYYSELLNGVFRSEGSLTEDKTFIDLEGFYSGVADAATIIATGLATGTDPDTAATIAGLSWPTQATLTSTTEHDFWQFLIGFDKNVWIRPLNPIKMFSTSLQFYYTNIESWRFDPDYRPYNKKHHYRISGSLRTDYHHGRWNPSIFMMYDPQGSFMTSISFKYVYGNFYWKISEMSFWGRTEQPAAFSSLVDTSELSFVLGYNW
ncbi:MAG: DUF1302 family protein [Thermodesulfobacteriota bacterium]|nr:DUF1302 family protein [Thermodesulfobacteriota bacterium]